ncbi:hemin uptake protein HemP [Puniceibacterium sediminis]|uniref:Hemin uptake protein hemP n=1 Tax=Puniceibacterium sediminis TaxID=1608407 RepID=A0A238ZVK6_9RHOB|nr:hemin uptake protein HemP [Puniceibacterium sediminis]SNR87259.1 Hemin uptake protein hemP [Puniceibacterium sediminis]
MTTSTPQQTIVRAGESEDVVCYDARDLIQNGVQAHLTLDGQFYTLRITRAGKLILTK